MRDDFELLAEIQEAASLAGLAHVYPPAEYPFPTEAVRERWRTSTDEIVVDPEGRGFVAVTGEWLEAMYVRPVAWGSGLADELHDRAVEALRANGVERAPLGARAQ